MRVVILAGDPASRVPVPEHWDSEHEVALVLLPRSLARLHWRRGPVALDAGRWAFAAWAALSDARHAIRRAELVVAADPRAQPLAWVLARTGRRSVAGLDGAEVWLRPDGSA